jgi:hypothetical protein
MPPAARVAGRTIGEALAYVARAKQKQIRTKPLKFLDSKPGKQAITGGRRRVGSDFRHQQGLPGKRGQHMGS